MIEHGVGNLLEADVEALVNTVNTVGVMGRGIALQMRQRFPSVYEVYRRACARKEVQPGRMLVVATGELGNPKYVINFPTKRHWRGKARIEDIELGLVDLVRAVQAHGITSVAVPPLGCGNGGLDWSVVRPLIVSALDAIPSVRVLLYEPDGTPAARRMPVATTRPAMTPGRAALIAAMERYSRSTYRLTKLEIEKLAYLLQYAGQNLKLEFRPGTYGPYAEAVQHVLQRIEGHFTRGYGDRSQNSDLTLLPGASEEAEAFLRTDPETGARLGRVANLIKGFETPHGMELLTTVLWVMSRHPVAREDVEATVQLVHGWNARKMRLFPRDRITVAWKRLKETDWA